MLYGFCCKSHKKVPGTTRFLNGPGTFYWFIGNTR
jgi:hypothetical protein